MCIRSSRSSTAICGSRVRPTTKPRRHYTRATSPRVRSCVRFHALRRRSRCFWDRSGTTRSPPVHRRQRHGLRRHPNTGIDFVDVDGLHHRRAGDRGSNRQRRQRVPVSRPTGETTTIASGTRPTDSGVTTPSSGLVHQDYEMQVSDCTRRPSRGGRPSGSRTPASRVQLPTRIDHHRSRRRATTSLSPRSATSRAR